MQIQLKQAEIEQAIKRFIKEQGFNLQQKEVTIEFTSGRKDNGLSAEITIENISAKETEETSKKNVNPFI